MRVLIVDVDVLVEALGLAVILLELLLESLREDLVRSVLLDARVVVQKHVEAEIFSQQEQANDLHRCELFELFPF